MTTTAEILRPVTMETASLDVIDEQVLVHFALRRRSRLVGYVFDFTCQISVLRLTALQKTVSCYCD